MKIVEIHSDKPINNVIREQIKEIFVHSQCPYEGLRNSIPDFESFDGRVVQLGEGDKYKETIKIYCK